MRSLRRQTIKSRSTGNDKRPPPPSIVLSTQREVGGDDGDLGCRDGQDDGDDEEESEEVVELILPDSVEDEEQLDEHGSKRKDSGDQRAGNESQVPRLFWDLPGDLVGAYRVRVRLFAVSEVEAEEDQRHVDAEPHDQQGDHCSEGNSSR